MYNEERVFDVSASDMLNIQHSSFIIVLFPLAK